MTLMAGVLQYNISRIPICRIPISPLEDTGKAGEVVGWNCMSCGQRSGGRSAGWTSWWWESVIFHPTMTNRQRKHSKSSWLKSHVF